MERRVALCLFTLTVVAISILEDASRKLSDVAGQILVSLGEEKP